MSRYGGNGKIVRDTSFSNYAIKDPSWTDDYLDAVSKYSVKSKREDSQLFEQITQILGGTKSKYSSVEEAVLDMQKRTGLFDLMQKKAEEVKEESMLDKFPDLKEFIKEKVDAFPGSAVDAISDMVFQVEKYKNSIPAGGHIPIDVKEYINKIKKEVNSSSDDQNDSSDGKIDLDHNSGNNDNDPFKFLTPTSF